MESVASYDWAAFLNEKLENTGSDAPLEGIERGSYGLVNRKIRQGAASVEGSAD